MSGRRTRKSSPLNSEKFRQKHRIHRSQSFFWNAGPYDPRRNIERQGRNPYLPKPNSEQLRRSLAAYAQKFAEWEDIKKHGQNPNAASYIPLAHRKPTTRRRKTSSGSRKPTVNTFF